MHVSRVWFQNFTAVGTPFAMKNIYNRLAQMAVYP